MPSDETIIEEIRAELANDHRIPHPREIALSARNGVVTLRGSVGSVRQRQSAVEIAKAVDGVNDLEDELAVDLLDHWNDDELRGAAIQALMSSPEVPDDRIEVRVADSWLTLGGEVKHQYESDAAFEVASGVPGIGGITNRIVVITSGMDG